ncbi:MAG: rod shape-determining protein [Candidatus Magasanikbacteria bacterium CG10_big_fil_rev_8_21_14_0_10_36_32]|uniref:Cell shape-determining protein MreB n=1 Tax=Candidatus Magasanikbacteria bacterium CG10_big_fil_rev_8_21_14_0_10_36_32 TaxID=1974646 RepID=A0A2M6W657_9BACT|nr:MAG: rod shape-determining protein [Candidatus Magasanikbacteria bacterium CG10_big_fil_rev_8_21_14_0_10_36_32]
MFIKKIGIDLGTNNVLVYVPKKGIVINEPSVVAISKNDGKILAVGLEAKDMLGRTPDTISAEHPLKEGVIANYKTTEAMLRYFINKALGGVHLFRPEVMVAVPAGITSIERRAVIDATIAAGARAAYIIKAPIVAAIGADIPIGAASGHMVINIGGGTAEIAVISLGGIVAWGSVRIGGNKFDQAITEFVRHKYNLSVGVHTAEEIKKSVGTAMFMSKPLSVDIKGQDMASGLPHIVSVTSDDVAEALQHDLDLLIKAIGDVLHDTPPELSADIMDKGIILTGGSAQLRNLNELVAQATGVPTYVAEEPMFCAVKGTGIALENIDSYKRSILATR